MIAWDRGYRVRENGDVYRTSGEEVSVSCCPKGYRFIKIQKRSLGINHRAHVHRLAALCKYGEFSVDLLVRHLNDIKSDNSWLNIALGTTHDNAMDIPREKRVAKALKGAAVLRTVSVEIVREIRRRHKEGEQGSSIARDLGIHKGKISNIINGVTYSTVI